jgi:hypothetical protein
MRSSTLLRIKRYSLVVISCASYMAFSSASSAASASIAALSASDKTEADTAPVALASALAAAHPRDKITLSVVREAQNLTVKVTLGELPAS